MILCGFLGVSVSAPSINPLHSSLLARARMRLFPEGERSEGAGEREGAPKTHEGNEG